MKRKSQKYISRKYLAVSFLIIVRIRIYIYIIYIYICVCIYACIIRVHASTSFTTCDPFRVGEQRDVAVEHHAHRGAHPEEDEDRVVRRVAPGVRLAKELRQAAVACHALEEAHDLVNAVGLRSGEAIDLL